MPTPIFNDTPTDAQVAAQNNPGTGALSGPDSGRANRPDMVGAPLTDRDANTNNGTVDRFTRDHPSGSIPPDFDFDIQVDPEPRPNGDVRNLDQAFGEEPQPGGQTPVDKLVVNFRGQPREYGMDAVTNMVQQYLNIQDVSPVVGRVRTLASAMGVTDPNQMAQLTEQAIMEYVQRNSGGQPAATGPADIQVPQPGTGQNPVMDALAQAQQVDAEAIVDRWFNDNGIVPTDEMRSVFVNNVRYGRLIEQVGTVLPTLMQDVDAFKQEKAQQIAEARANNVASVADRVANELGIDTPEEAQAFMAWVNQQEQFIPNYRAMIGQNPAAMENAIRTYAGVNMGQRAMTERDNLKQTVQQNLSRAGGEVVASRGAAGVTGNTPAPKDFNRQMLDML